MTRTNGAFSPTRSSLPSLRRWSRPTFEIALSALLAIVASCGLATVSFAHPGGVNDKGCHVNKKTNESHCHSEPLRAKQLSTCDLQRPPASG
jgi:hypothetical protein